MRKFIDIVIIITLVLLTTTTVAKAEYSVGFAAGGTRGAGVTYRYLQDEGPWGWQVTGLPIIHPDNGIVSLGAQVLYILNRGREVMAYTSFGSGVIAAWDNCEEEPFCEDERHLGAGIGPGIGFELRMLDNVSFSVDIPLALLFADGEFRGILPLPNVALMYYW